MLTLDLIFIRFIFFCCFNASTFDANIVKNSWNGGKKKTNEKKSMYIIICL